VSRSEVHTAAIRFRIIPENYSASMQIRADLDARVSNSGRTHLDATRVEAFDPNIDAENGETQRNPFRAMLLETRTRESGITIAQTATTKLDSDSGPVPVEETVAIGSGSIAQTLTFDARRGAEYVFDKVVTIFTSRDGFADPADVSMHCSR